MSQLVGYARVSTAEQNPAAQLDMLKAANCERVFVETASGAQRNWPELAKALDYMRAGDVLVVWRLDRLTRSVRQLVDTASELRGMSIELRSLHDARLDQRLERRPLPVRQHPDHLPKRQ